MSNLAYIDTANTTNNTSRSEGFAKAYDWLLFDSSISDQAKILFFILMRYNRNGNCYPGQERLAKDTGKTPRTIRRILDELYEAGLVDNQGRIEQRRSNTYLLAESVVTTEQAQSGLKQKTTQPNKTELRLVKSQVVPEQDENVRSVGTKTSYKVESFKEILKPLCENDSTLCQVKASDKNPVLENSNNHEESEMKVAKTPTDYSSSNQTQTIVEIAEIVQMYLEAGVFEREARLIAHQKPIKTYATALILASSASWVKDKAALIVYYGLRGLLPTPRSTVPSAKKPSRSYAKNRGAKAGNPIDFTKYTYLDSTNTDSNSFSESTLARTAHDTNNVAQPVKLTNLVERLATKPDTSSTQVGLKHVIRQLDTQAYRNLKQLQVEADTLLVSFYNCNQIPNVASWLPMLKYHAINQIRVV
jgi:hypothetical protein